MTETTSSIELNWPNRALGLGERFCYKQNAESLSDVELLHWNDRLAEQLGLNKLKLSNEDKAAYFSGNSNLPGSEPASFVYSGHQFGVYVPQLGDGRALWLGELTAPNGNSWEFQLKGSGRTPFSRMGDGKAVLRSSIREYLISEAMVGLGIPTTQGLALVGSPEKVYREEVETAAVVTRVAPSFFRFGSVEYFFYTKQHEELKHLLSFVIENYYPHLLNLTEAERMPRFYKEVCERTGSLLAQWQSVGFCHGVMNTDNFSLLGLTIDYGPYGFLELFDPAHICNHSDHSGRYAFNQQPAIGQWNCQKLGEAMSPFLTEEEFKAGLEAYNQVFHGAFIQLFRQKLGLTTEEEADVELIKALFGWMAQTKVDHTNFFRRLSTIQEPAQLPDFLERLKLPPFTDRSWFVDYFQRLERERKETGRSQEARQQAMDGVNPARVLRNYLAQEVIDAAKQGNLSPLNELFTALQHPYEEREDWQRYSQPAPSWAQGLTVSCSS